MNDATIEEQIALCDLMIARYKAGRTFNVYDEQGQRVMTINKIHKLPTDVGPDFIDFLEGNKRNFQNLSSNPAGKTTTNEPTKPNE